MTFTIVSPKRWVELEAAFDGCKVGLVYVTAFPDRAEFRKNAADIAWETEVWVADNPDHMIHFNGDRFLALSINGSAIIKAATIDGRMIAPTTSISPSKYFNS